MFGTCGSGQLARAVIELFDILEAQTAIRGTDPSLVAALAQRAEGDLDWYRRPPPPEAAEPQVIRIVMGEQAAEPQRVATPPTPPALGG